MVNKLLTYSEAINLINSYFEKNENLYKYCRKNKPD